MSDFMRALKATETEAWQREKQIKQLEGGTMSKTIQIFQGDETLFALKDDGTIWAWNKHTKWWEQMPEPHKPTDEELQERIDSATRLAKAL